MLAGNQLRIALACAFARSPALAIAFDVLLEDRPGIGSRDADQLFGKRPTELEVLIVDRVAPVTGQSADAGSPATRDNEQELDTPRRTLLPFGRCRLR